MAGMAANANRPAPDAQYAPRPPATGGGHRTLRGHQAPHGADIRPQTINDMGRRAWRYLCLWPGKPRRLAQTRSEEQPVMRDRM